MSECKFKVGDNVLVVSNRKKLNKIGINPDILPTVVTIIEIDTAFGLPILARDDKNLGVVWHFREEDLEPITKHSVSQTTAETRAFSTGATRDTIDGKLSFYKALSPVVLERYVQYLGKHRLQSDGKLRDWDNWKKGIPVDTYCDSLLRHTHDVWKLTQGGTAHDNHGEVDVEDALCAVLFNAMGCLYEILKRK
jgi:hypothetical protein